MSDGSYKISKLWRFAVAVAVFRYTVQLIPSHGVTKISKFALFCIFNVLKNRNFAQKWKFWSKIEICSKIEILVKRMEMLLKNSNFGPK